uniref:Uncharacterized protein n=1 Tax=Oryza barthii TaxID=65489 RepID=A0A0D3HWF1_9ORYZ
MVMAKPCPGGEPSPSQERRCDCAHAPRDGARQWRTARLSWQHGGGGTEAASFSLVNLAKPLGGGYGRLQAREATPIDSAGGRRGDGREASVVAARRPVTAGMPLRHAVVDRRGGRRFSDVHALTEDDRCWSNRALARIGSR